MSDTKKYKVIDLFCGIGGFSYGFEMTGLFEVVCAADIWETALQTFKLNHSNKNIELVLHDLTTLKDEYWSKYKNNVDVIIAGPPCQGFSMSGKREVGDKRNSLFEEVIRITKIVNPTYVVIENVVGLLSMKNEEGVDIKELISTKFNSIGYNVEYKVLNAADFGVPQLRKRVIFIASKKEKITFPKSLLKEEDYVTVGDALGNIDPDGDLYFEASSDFQIKMSGRKDIQNHIRRQSNELVTKRMSFIPEGGNWKDIPEELGTGGGVHSNAYKRLDSKRPSITIKHAAKAMIIHPYRNRIVTVREVARLQSFPDDFVITGSTSDQHQQLANAVPPFLGKAIAEEISKNLSSSNEFKFIDLFSGMGGFRIAFENNAFKCVFSSEIDNHARETYYNNFNEYPQGDITLIDENDIPDFDVLCAGFPCQPFSVAGKRLGFEDTRGTLFFDIVRILKAKKPVAFLLENVRGIVNHDSGNTIKVIETTLKELGYNFEWRILNAKEYGIPQNRERWYCVGFQQSIINSTNFAWPEKRELEYHVSDIISTVQNDEYNVTETCLENIKKHVSKKGIEIDDSTLAYEIRPSRCQFARENISPCLTAKMGTGGNNVPVLIKQQRKLTERECLKIMGFPNDYKINKGYQSYKQIGNSVVVPIIELLSKEIKRILEKGDNLCE